MTWREFKEAVERLGVKDDDEIGFIDIQGGEELKIYKPKLNLESKSIVSWYPFRARRG